MYQKTTSIDFKEYGLTFSDIGSKYLHRENTIIKDLTDKEADYLFLTKSDLYIKVLEGIVLLLVSKDLNSEPERFVIHQIVNLKKGVYYAFISISDYSRLEMASPTAYNDKSYKLLKPYRYKRLRPSLKIEEIYSYYYVVRSTNYHFYGETHNFWELTIVSYGQLRTKVDNEVFVLNENDILLYAPGQFHNQYTDEDHTCSYITIIFAMDLKNSKQLKNRIFKCGREIRNYVEDFVKYSSSRDIPYNDDLLIADLEKIIIYLLRSDYVKELPLSSTPMQQKYDSELLDGIINYVNENIYNPITIEELCEKFSLSRSTLQILFKNNLEVAPKQYISDLKLAKAKQLIKESSHTISEIATICGFGSIHYFSRKFKATFGITPTDYAKSFTN